MTKWTNLYDFSQTIPPLFTLDDEPRFYTPNIQCEGKIILGRERVNVLDMIISMQQRIDDLESKVEQLTTHIMYAPGGGGYNEAKAHFESIVNKNNQDIEN
jgi:hypothetical protein